MKVWYNQKLVVSWSPISPGSMVCCYKQNTYNYLVMNFKIIILRYFYPSLDSLWYDMDSYFKSNWLKINLKVYIRGIDQSRMIETFHSGATIFWNPRFNCMDDQIEGDYDWSTSIVTLICSTIIKWFDWRLILLKILQKEDWMLRSIKGDQDNKRRDWSSNSKI